MLKVAIYGKGGIGKSTTCSNLAAALSKRYRVMQIGCDPKADSTKNLLGGKKIRSVLEALRETGDETELKDLVHEGYGGVLCVESGGPMPGVGCAGLGIISAFQKLEELEAFEIYKPDIVLYDVLGDVVCGGFAMPIRDGYAEHVLIVTSGEMMALFAADNINRAVKHFEKRERRVKDERALVERFAEESGLGILQTIRRSDDVQRAEESGRTVIEAFPDCEVASDYFALAELVAGLMNGEEKA